MTYRQFRRSLRYAWRGLAFTFRHEQNFRIQLALSWLVLMLTSLFPLRKGEIIVVLLLIMAVLILELLNTALEKFVDIMRPRLQYQVATVKDIMAAMVMVASIGSAIVGLIIFLPYILPFRS